MPLIRKNKLGEMGVHFYRLNGIVEAVECSVAEYDSLALPNAGPPTLPVGAIWIQSIKRPKFDTPDGALREGEYASDGKGTVWVRPVGGMEVLVKETDIINGEPNIKALGDIEKQKITTALMIEIKQK